MIVTDANEKMLTVKEVAGLLNIHPNTLRRWSEQGRIVTYKINSRGDRRFKRSDIEKFLDDFNPYKQNS
jgi:excisionase family DNA binding protein